MTTEEKLRKLMEQRGWTLYRLGKETDLAPSTLSNVFRRCNEPTLPTLEAICKAFGITLAQFFAEEGETVSLTAEQQMLFSRWSALTTEQQAALLELMRTMEQ